MALQYSKASAQEAALVSEDVELAPPPTIASRLVRPLAVAAGAAILVSVGFCAAGPKKLSWAAFGGATMLGTAAPVDQWKIMETQEPPGFSTYPGYAGTLEVGSDSQILLDVQSTKQTLQWVLKLKGSDVDECADKKQLTNGECSMYITEGTSCTAATGNQFYNGSNPYNQIHYNPKAGSMLQYWTGGVYGRQLGVETGYEAAQLNGKTVIVTDSTGARAGCAVLGKSELKELPKLTPDLSDGPPCFPGDASASVQGVGAVRLSELGVGDSVLVRRSSGELAYEPLLGFLHSTKGSSSFLSVLHAGGELRASANHLIFVADGTARLASKLRAGDSVLALDASGKAVPSVVLSVRDASGTAGMVAPLTMAGSIVVDGAVASAYATYHAEAFIPHGAMHALFFPARLLARMTSGAWGAGPSPKSSHTETMHPLARVYAWALIPIAKAVVSP